MLTSMVLLMASLASTIPTPQEEPRTILDLEQRVAAREAIARVQYRHQVQATIPFEEAVPSGALARDVTDMLAKSAVLEARWGVRITARMLQAEAARIASSTRRPARLAELEAALRDDPVLIQEALVRPALVARLFQEKFDNDPLIQSGRRAEAEALAGVLADGSLDPALDHPRRRSVESMASGPQAVGADSPRQARPRVTVAGGILDEPGAFVVRARLEQHGRTLMVEYAVPRVTWQEWWPANAAGYATEPQLAVTAPGAGSSPSLATSAALVDECTPEDTWATTRLSFDGPIAGAHTAFWTGNVYVVIAAPTAMARFDPVLDVWLPMSLAGAPPGHRPAGVWSGSEVILYGGAVAWSSPMQEQYLGGRYNPITDEWTPFGPGIYSRTGASAVWTGSKMLMWGGQCSPATEAGCAAYPGTTAWARYLGDGLAYEPSTGTLTQFPSPLGGRIEHTAVWTGTRMIVYGGFYTFRIGSTGTTNGWDTFGDGGIYDPQTGAWTYIPVSDVAQRRHEHGAAWDGSGMYVEGGRTSTKDYVDGVNVFINEARNTLVRFDPGTGAWEALGALPISAPGQAALWTGRLLLTWGQVSGGRYDPATGTWSNISVINAPEVRENAAIVWDGEAMFVQGGSVPNPLFHYMSDGGRYFPEAGDLDLDGDGYSRCTGDCNDAAAGVNPGAAEVCNGLDDDCDTALDEGNPGGGVTCGVTDVGPCSLGITECSSGTLICAGEIPPNAEICNGEDDDCDGAADDGNPGGGDACGLDIGACTPGLTACENGSLVCVGDVGPQPEICDGLDNDCDGEVPAAESDADGDGYRGCNGDCDDDRALTYPGGVEWPGNIYDDNCDGTAVCSPAMAWKNNGAYAMCVVRACLALVDSGQATPDQCLIIIGAAIRSDVGLKSEQVPPGEGYEEVLP